MACPRQESVGRLLTAASSNPDSVISTSYFCSHTHVGSKIGSAPGRTRRIAFAILLPNPDCVMRTPFPNPALVRG